MAVSLLEARRQILLNTPHIESASGSIATFNTDLSANLTDMKIHFHPVQEGTGDPSPDNIMSIHGWDGLTVSKSHKNLMILEDFNVIRNAWVNGGIVKSTASYDLYYMPIPRNTTLIISRKEGSPSVVCVCATATAPAVIGGSSIFTLPTMTNRQRYVFESDEATYLWFSINRAATVSDFEWQLEIGTARTEYEEPQILTVQFPQTIYGGYVDLVKGEVVEEYGTEVLNGSEVWGTQAENDTYYIKFLHSLSGGVVTGSLNSGGLSNYIKTATSNEELKKTGNLCCRFGWSDRSLYILNAPIGLNGVTDLTSFKSYLSENNLVVVYPLATPNTYSLTSQTIKSLKGINNIWSDANGNIEVKFWKH